ncbi:50S ribosomal protein L13, partial [Candidatus Micrarchaeota archaeon]|nr:50S ribosomal protein L13 [Candidatus Micrarchaeota archaeon]
NAEKIIISGNPSVVVDKYMNKRSAKDKANPEHSPHWPRRPDLLVKRIVRGMLPFNNPRGRRAFKNLRVYIGIPQEFANASVTKPENIDKEKLQCKYITISDLCINLGYNPR